MVTLPCPAAIVALRGLFRFTNNVSSASLSASPLMTMLIVLLVSPEAKVMARFCRRKNLLCVLVTTYCFPEIGAGLDTVVHWLPAERLSLACKSNPSNEPVDEVIITESPDLLILSAGAAESDAVGGWFCVDRSEAA